MLQRFVFPLVAALLLAGAAQADKHDDDLDAMDREMQVWVERIDEHADDANDALNQAWGDAQEAWGAAQEAGDETWEATKDGYDDAMERLGNAWEALTE
ncbi:MAG: hypothetical protein CMM46_14260 [Rhodospirillaceae bacterium]|nr:hypothetical protein [Rhodospirillaceae bacterium]|tara:strand:- start:3249 stop:3545 length:297 start_codon:yes stop_codon:yes gene_type:complete